MKAIQINIPSLDDPLGVIRGCDMTCKRAGKVYDKEHTARPDI